MPRNFEQSDSVTRTLVTAGAAIVPFLTVAPVLATPAVTHHAAYTPPHPKTESDGCQHDGQPVEDRGKRLAVIGAEACYQADAKVTVEDYIEERHPGGHWHKLHSALISRTTVNHDGPSESYRIVKLSLPKRELYNDIVDGNDVRVEVDYSSDLGTVGGGELIYRRVTADQVSPMVNPS